MTAVNTLTPAQARAIARRWGCSPARCPLAGFSGAVASEAHRKALLGAISERVDYFTADRPRPVLYRQREAQAVTELRLLEAFIRQAKLQPPARPARKGMKP